MNNRTLAAALVVLASAAFLASGYFPEGFPDGERDAPAAAEPMQAPPGPLRVDRAREALDRMTVAPAGTLEGYARDEFGYDWLDLDSDSCNTREEILARDMRYEVRPDGCNVESGVLVDPYTGSRITFSENEDASAVQVDHVVPLGRAWQTGADTWTDDKRERFANDPLNLIATSGSVNASKGARGPGEWRPPAESGWCLYGVRYVRVVTSYDLTVTTSDATALNLMLDTCS